jgi:mRNA interferase MazF
VAHSSAPPDFELLPLPAFSSGWREAGLHVPSAVKRGLCTAHETLVVKTVGRLVPADMARVTEFLRGWLG